MVFIENARPPTGKIATERVCYEISLTFPVTNMFQEFGRAPSAERRKRRQLNAWIVCGATHPARPVRHMPASAQQQSVARVSFSYVQISLTFVEVRVSVILVIRRRSRKGASSENVTWHL